MDREYEWMKKRCGRITASELGDLTSASGRIIDGNVAYIRKKRWERRHGFALPVSSKTMEVGNDTEPVIFQWVKANIDPEGGRYVYSKDEAQIPIWIPQGMPCFSASPDAYTEDHRVILEFKTLVGNEQTEFYMDERTSYAEKAARASKEHLPQVLGLLMSEPKAERVRLVKYAPQRDEVMDDLDSPLAPWRGVVFDFLRSDYLFDLARMEQLVRMFDRMIDSDVNPSSFKNGWSYDAAQGVLVNSLTGEVV